MSNDLVVAATAALSIIKDVPDYLVGNENTGLEAFNKEDFNIPQLKLIHQMSPEVDTYKGAAIPGEYWHSGLMRSLGPSILSIMVVARKRVVLWRPRNDQGGGILAQSNDGFNWHRGGNSTFTVNLKGVKNPVQWKTGPNVEASGLKEFGTSNPDDPESAPAADLFYEYINYLPEIDNASPCLSRFHKTGLKPAKDLNSYFLYQATGKSKIPVYACVIKMSVVKKPGPEGDYFVPVFTPSGYADKNTYMITKEMHERYKDVILDIQQEAENDNNAAEANINQAF